MFDLKEVIFSITNRCNLRCRMCDIPFGRIEELSTEQWKEVIKNVSRLGAQTIVFSGGEPLLREDIFELISFTKKNGLNACVTSNGNLINQQVALNLSASGVNVVNVSIEGSKTTHDFLRGAGSFDQAVAGLENLRKHRIESTVASTVSKYNYEDLLYVLEVAKNCGATTVRLQPFSPIFLKDHQRKNEFLIPKSDIQKLEKIIKKFIDISQEYKISTNPVSYLLKIPTYLAGKRFFTKNCGALWYSCPINPNGDVFPCWVEGTNSKLIGNVKDQSLYELWLSDKRIKMVKAIINNGCNGCLMSCYDEAFGGNLAKEDIFNKVKKIKKLTDGQRVINKIRQFLKSQLIRAKLRYRFYVSYRGSLTKLLGRRLAGFFHKTSSSEKNISAKKEAILLEISQAKKKLKKEIHTQ